MTSFKPAQALQRPTPRPASPPPPPKREVKPPVAKTMSRDELSAGRGAALQKRAAQYLRPVAPPPAPVAATDTYTVAPGDSYNRIAETRATEFLAAQGMKPTDPAYSTTWHRLAYRMTQELMASNGSRPLRPGDQLILPDPAKYGLVPGAAPAAPVVPQPAVPQSPAQQSPGQVPPPAVPGTPVAAGGAMVNQFAGDPNGSNANCGFTSSLMALRLLGIESPALQGSNYDQAMTLRQLGGGGTVDTAWGTVNQVVRALTAAGAHATAVPNSWGSNKMAAVELMKQAFLSGTPTAFVVAGNPALGWPDQVSYNGGHFVTVAGYDAASNTFTVLDPVSHAPFQVTPQQLANYLKDGNAEQGEVIQVTR